MKTFANPNKSKGLTTEEKKANAEYIYFYLRKKGWSVQAICGLLGNIEHESYLNPAAWQSNIKDLNNGDIGYGLVQFSPASKYLKIQDKSYLPTIDDLANNPKALIITQLNFIINSSLYGSEWLPKTGMLYHNVPYYINFVDFTKSTNKPDELALVFNGNYERSNDGLEIIRKRGNLANKWYEYFSNKG